MTTPRSLIALLVTMSALAAAPAVIAEEQSVENCSIGIFALLGGFNWSALNPERDCPRSTYVPTESLASPGGDAAATIATAVNSRPNPDQFKVVTPDPDWTVSEDDHPDLNPDMFK